MGVFSNKWANGTKVVGYTLRPEIKCFLNSELDSSAINGPTEQKQLGTLGDLKKVCCHPTGLFSNKWANGTVCWVHFVT